MTAVAHLIGHLRLGAGRHVLETALEQRRRGWQVEVLVSPDIDSSWRTDPSMVDELRGAGIEVGIPGDFFARDLKKLLATASALRRRWPDPDRVPVIHAHSAMPCVVGRWAGANKVIVTCHGMCPGREAAFDLQDAIAFRLADAVVSPSHFWAERLARDYGICGVRVIPYGLDLDRYPPLQPADGSESSAMRVLVLSELTRRKGIDILIDAIPGVLRDLEDVEFHFFGTGSEEESLRERASGVQGAAERIFFHGFVRDPYRKLAEFDLLCLPTRSDNLPLSIMEAMLAGLPVLSTRVGGIPELVERAGCGVVVEAGSAQALADAMIRLLKLGHKELRRLGNDGFDLARGTFSIAPAVDRLLALYRS